MRISLVIVEGAKQIMITPETKHEKQCLKIIKPDDKLKVVSKWGSFTEGHNSHAKLQVEECKANYLRAFSNENSLIFLIEDK